METSVGCWITQGRRRCNCDVQSMEEGTVEARDGHAFLQWEGRGEARGMEGNDCLRLWLEMVKLNFLMASLTFCLHHQAAVGLDFFSRWTLMSRELFILQFLALGLGPDLVQLLLQGPDLSLDLGQLCTVVALRSP